MTEPKGCFIPFLIFLTTDISLDIKVSLLVGLMIPRGIKSIKYFG